MNNELINNLSISCNHSKATKDVYFHCLNEYSLYFNQNLQELLIEAENDENNRIKWKHCRLKAKLIEYRHYLLGKFAFNTVKKHMNCILNFYKFYDVEIQKLPKLNEKSIKKPQPIYFKDLPDKEVIREALKLSSPLLKAIILFSCSSGCGRAETLSLTIQDYINALSEYLPDRKTDIFEIIDYLNETNEIIPAFRVLRRKTNKYYITYCSSEAVEAINAYILTRKDKITNDSKLFKINRNYLTELFRKTNDRLGLGLVGDYSRLRCHMLRKFHASALYNDGMSLDKINDLQGKAKNKTNEAYFMTNPDNLKLEYIEHLPAISINKDVEKLYVKSSEFIRMESENKELKSELGKIKDDITNIKKYFENDF